MSETWDAIIIGGGPAGAATAISAQQRGCRVLVLEAETFPRHHVGESLVDLWLMFEMLGVAEEMDATFEHKKGSSRVWGRDFEVHSGDFSYVPGPRKYSLQVERSLFDLILLQRAEAVGATVRQGHRVTAVLWEGERAVGVRYRAPDGSTHEVRAPFVIDASGRASLIARQLRLQVIDPFYPDLTVYGYFENCQRFPGEQAGNLLIEVVPWGWMWFIPLHTGEVSVGLVCDQSTRSLIRSQGLTRFLCSAAQQSTTIRRLLADARLTRGPIATASYGYVSARHAGPGWILVGDAGAFTDPMWATGVALALISGITAGALIEGMLKRPELEPAIIAYYDRDQASRIEGIDGIVKFAYWCNQLYADQPFWRRRHQYLIGHTLSRSMVHRLGPHSGFGSYFKAVIQGMGVEREVLALLEDEVEASQRRWESATHLLQEPDRWVPVLSENVTIRRGVGCEVTMDSVRLVDGLEIDHEGKRWYIDDPYGIATFEAVDGRRSVQEIVDHVLATVPVQGRFELQAKLLAGFLHGHAEGILVARPYPRDSADVICDDRFIVPTESGGTRKRAERAARN